MELAITPLPLPLRVNWKLSRNSTSEKLNFIVELKDGEFSGRSEIAPNIRYGETPEIILQEFETFKQLIARMPYDRALNEQPWKHSLRFALESAYLSLEADRLDQPLHVFLKLPSPGTLATSMSVPIMDKLALPDYVANIRRFASIKIKVSAETARDMVHGVAQLAPGTPLRIDGNEAWHELESFWAFHETLKGLNVEFIEQPFPAARKDLYQALHKRTPYVIMADESIEDADNLEELATMFGAVNIKLMKTGSLLKGRDFLIKARALGLKTMVGCMIETSLGISYAMQLQSLIDWADLDGFLLLKEDPFHLVTETEGILKLT